MLTALLVLMCTHPYAAAQPPSPAVAEATTVTTVSAALSRVAQQADRVQSSWFTPEFAGAIPSIQGGFKSFASEYGNFVGVDDLGSGLYTLRYAGGSVTVQASVNARGQLSRLFLKGQQANPSPAPVPAPAPVAVSSQAGTLSVPAAITRLFGAAQPSADWLAPSFLEHISISQFSAILSQLKAPLGTFQSVKANPDGTYTAQFSGGTLPINAAAVDAQGRLTTFAMGMGVPTKPPTLEAALANFKAQAGQSSVVVIEDGKPIASLAPQQALAVGSSFKLGILAELQAQIKAGKHRWDEVVPLQEANKSLPSGFLQSWPAGSLLTVQSLAALMISQSDNTATDTLLNLVGREGVTQRLGLSSVISTRELFALKNPENKALLSRYLAATTPVQRASVLTDVARAPLPAPTLFASEQAIVPQVEWFVPVTTLCGLMAQVADLPLTQINPGVADPKAFKQVSYKGGSEVGVLNYTTQVTTSKGRTVCISATVNSPSALNEQAISVAYARLLQAVR